MILVDLVGNLSEMINMWRLLFVVVFAVTVHSDGGSLLQPCLMNDIECLSKSTEQFLENTCKGIPQYDIRAIDPLIVPSLDCEVDSDMGLQFLFKNLNVTGFRNQKISDFKMNTENKKVVLQTRADLHIVGDITIKLTKDSKVFEGIYYADSGTLCTARYDYDLKKDDKGVEHFEVGPETIECEAITEPTVSLSPELQTALANDPIALSKLPTYTEKKVPLRKKVISEIAKKGYVNVVHNIRASAKILPKSAFFKDI